MPVCCLAARRATFCSYRLRIGMPFRRAKNGPSQMRNPVDATEKKKTEIFPSLANREHREVNCLIKKGVLEEAVRGNYQNEPFIHSFIADIYIAHFKWGYSEALPTPARPSNVVLSC